MTIDLDRYARDIPVMPSVAAKILSMASGDMDMSFRQLEDIIKVDQGLTARILKIANSAQYARQREITQLQSAITLLGFKTLKNLVLLVAASGMFSRIQKSRFYQDHWYHSLLTAFLARSIALRCRAREVAEETFLAGLFHDVGKVVLYSADVAGYTAILEREREEGVLLREAEAAALGVEHQRIGGALLDRWSFPRVFVDAALEHDSINITSVHKKVIIMVTVANCIAARFAHESVPRERERLLTALYPHTCLAPGDVADYTENLFLRLSEDRLFSECLGLFGVKPTT